MENLASGDRRPARAPLSETPAFLISVGLCVICIGYWLLLTKVYHFTNAQAAELAIERSQRDRHLGGGACAVCNAPPPT